MVMKAAQLQEGSELGASAENTGSQRPALPAGRAGPAAAESSVSFSTSGLSYHPRFASRSLWRSVPNDGDNDCLYLMLLTWR